jgi:hypothetical protein
MVLEVALCTDQLEKGDWIEVVMERRRRYVEDW